MFAQGPNGKPKIAVFSTAICNPNIALKVVAREHEFLNAAVSQFLIFESVVRIVAFVIIYCGVRPIRTWGDRVAGSVNLAHDTLEADDAEGVGSQGGAMMAIQVAVGAGVK